MVRLFRWLVFGDGHLHRWAEVKSGGIVSASGARVGTFYDCRCEICGCFKAFNLKA